MSNIFLAIARTITTKVIVLGLMTDRVFEPSTALKTQSPLAVLHDDADVEVRKELIEKRAN